VSARKPQPQSKHEASTVASSNKPAARKADDPNDSPTAFVIGDAEEDFQILQERGYATLLDFDEEETYN
jgi:hypothetical protein